MGKNKIMRKIFLALILILIFNSCAFGEKNFKKENFRKEKEIWKIEKNDLRRALPNVTTPPDRLIPLNMLAPLEEKLKSEGIIRRVKIYDNKKVAALTFDMCELDTVTTGCDMDSLNFLRENNIPATLFMSGKWMRTHIERVKQIMREPIFEIANHAWSHGNCALLSPDGLKAQILWAQAQYELIKENLDKENLNKEKQVSPYSYRGDAADSGREVNYPVLFRLPYGRSSERALKIISELGMRVIQWDVAAEAGDNSKPENAKRNGKRVAAMTRPGSILLFHANLVPKGTALLLKEVVKNLTAQGYEFVTVSELLKMGEVETVRDGYFSTPGDNKKLDKKFGVDGTGRRTPFTGKI